MGDTNVIMLMDLYNAFVNIAFIHLSTYSTALSLFLYEHSNEVDLCGFCVYICSSVTIIVVYVSVIEHLINPCVTYLPIFHPNIWCPGGLNACRTKYPIRLMTHVNRIL